MEQILKQLVLWTYYHPHWAGAVVFIIALGECLPILGTIVPGSIVMTAIGTLIGADILPFSITIACATLGAFTGDSISFAAGYILKDDLKHVWPFKKRQHWLDKGQLFFKKHGRKSIFIARFIGPIRAIAPITAGALQMRPRHFYTTDFISAILWALIYMLPGILIGAFSLDLPPDIALHFIWWILLGLVALVVLSWLLRIVSIHIADVINDYLNNLWQRAINSSKYRLVTNALRHYNHTHPRGQLGVFTSFLFFAIAFITLTLHIAHNGPIQEYNTTLFHFFRSLRNLPTDKIMLAVTFLGDKHLLLLPIATAFCWLAYKRCWRAAAHWAALFLISYGSVGILKPMIQSPRPDGLAIPLSHYSFPSGHSTLSVAIFGFVAYLIATRWPPRVRWQCYLLGFFSAILVIISRLYLGAHWLTDVIGGMLLGLSCLFLIIISYQRHQSQRIKPAGFLLAFIAGLSLAWGIQVHAHFHKELANYQPVWSKKIIAIDDWWQNNGEDYPMYQVNRFGHPVDVLNIQWAGDIETITQTLVKNGWNKPVPFSWVTAIQHPELSHKYSIHIRTALFQDRKPLIILMKPIGHHQTLLLRLWETGTQFKNSANLLWAGTLTIHTDNHHPISEKDYQKLNQTTLKSTLSNIKNYQVQTKAIQLHNKKLFQLPTHGELILIKPKQTTHP